MLFLYYFLVFVFSSLLLYFYILPALDFLKDALDYGDISKANFYFYSFMLIFTCFLSSLVTAGFLYKIFS